MCGQIAAGMIAYYWEPTVALALFTYVVITSHKCPKLVENDKKIDIHCTAFGVIETTCQVFWRIIDVTF